MENGANPITTNCNNFVQRETAEKLIKENKIMVFSKSYCPYCVKAKEAISSLKYEYNAIELDNTANGDAIQSALLEMTGQRTVPNIFVSGTHVGGCDNTLAAIKRGDFQKLVSN